MKRVIFAYGHNISKQKCQDIDTNYPRLENLITDMWKMMENANGCGLASSQIGIPIRLFIVDSKTTFDNLEEAERKKYFAAGDEGITETFINAQIIERSIHRDLGGRRGLFKHPRFITESNESLENYRSVLQ